MVMSAGRKITAWGAAASALVAALAAGGMAAGAEPAQPSRTPAVAPRPEASEELALLMSALADPDAEAPAAIEERIIALWSRSGSPTADLLLERGRKAMAAGDLRAAVDHLSALVDHAPDFAEAWNARATAFFMMEEFGLALADIERALALNPQHFGALAGLGIILEQMDRPAEALAAFRAARALNPHREPVNEAVRRLAPMVDGRDI